MSRSEKVASLISALDEELAALDGALVASEEKLSAICKDIARHEELERAAGNASLEAKNQFENDIADLKEQIEPLKKELFRLQDELGADLAKKADLKTENVRLHTQNTHFKEYEAGAWKILKAKEAELIEREKALQQKESLRPQNNGLLPPIN